MAAPSQLTIVLWATRLSDPVSEMLHIIGASATATATVRLGLGLGLSTGSLSRPSTSRHHVDR